MARIPTFISDPTRTVAPGAPGAGYISADATGASIGDALGRSGALVGTGIQQLSQAVMNIGQVGGQIALQLREQEIKSGVANGVANYDFTNDYIKLQTNRPADVSYPEAVASAYDESVTKYVDGIGDSSVRTEVRQRLMSQKPGFVQSAQVFQNRENIAADKSAADSGVTLQLNRVRSDPSIDTYNDALNKSNAVIDARPFLTTQQKAEMKRLNGEQLALRRFEGLIQANMTDPVALDGVENELTAQGSPWKQVMSPEAYDRTLDRIVTLKKSANSQETAAARSALTSIRERHEKGEEIDPAEMRVVQDTVMASRNPALLSQFAMYARGQQIYREMKGLPLAQQREMIEKLRKQGGITNLPAPVQEGVTQGAALTGGEVSIEFLGGLVGAEYGAFLKSGDYGKRTIGGGSDATGVAQFISTTWRSVLRTHAAELGINPNASDGELDGMRSDPVLSIKAAALHARDNKRILESRLGRPATDGDLYTAHFLGVGGAVRFLTAAQQNPNGPSTQSVQPEQVAANKSIFYDPQGKERTNAQVRSLMSELLMNNVSRVDYAGVKAAALVYQRTVEKLKDDPMTYARTIGRFGEIGDLNTPAGVAKRGVVAAQVAEYYGIPSTDMKPLTKDEVEMFSRTVRDGTAEEKLGVMTRLAGLGNPEVVKAANKQLGEKDSLFAYAASMAFNLPERAGVAADIIRGETKIKQDKDVLSTLGATENDIQMEFTRIVGKALAETKQGTDTRKAAVAHYVERQIGRGVAQPGRFDKALFEESVQAVLGAAPGQAAVANVNGSQTLLPPNVSADTFTLALKRMSDNDYVAMSKMGSPPRYADGSVIKASEIASNGRFVALGGGEYRIMMGDGKFALAAAYKDGSADFYVFKATPEMINNIAQRQVVTTTPGQYVPRPGAAPRVIGNPTP